MAGTLGRQLVDGAKSVRLFGEDVPVRARIVTLGGFSAHAGQDALLEWVSHIQGGPKQGLYLVHGEPHACAGLAARIRNQLGWDAHIPADRECVEL